ncbi:MAG: hypothetical protein QM704_11135 [Anaeromyxobacteraceae bacterium]
MTARALRLALPALLLAACGGSSGDGGGGHQDPVVPLLSGSGGGAIAWDADGARDGGLLGGAFTFDAAGKMTAFDDVSGWGFSNGASDDFSADGLVAWGRWSAGTSTHPTLGGAIRHLHYAVTTSTHTTPASVLATLKRSYAAARSTATTATQGTTVTAGAADAVTGTLAVDYAAGTAAYDLTTTVAGQTFRLQGTGTFAKGGDTDSRIIGPSDGTVTSAGGCPTACGGWLTYGKHVQGLVVGPAGERAVLGFTITSPVVGNVSGLVVMR